MFVLKNVNVIATKNFGELKVVNMHEDALKTFKVGDSLAIAMFNVLHDEGVHLLTKIDDTTYEDKFIGYDTYDTGTVAMNYTANIDCYFTLPNGDENLYYWLQEIREEQTDVVVEVTPQLQDKFNSFFN